jgi:acetyltransferase-like isoleucine patch superfamily enzyme
MAVALRQSVSAGWLCERLGLSLIGPDREIRTLCALDSVSEDGLTFALPGRSIEHVHCGTIVALKNLQPDGASLIGSSKPRLDFIRAEYLLEENPGFAACAEPPRIHPSVKMGAGAVVESGATIGEGTVIGPNAVIRSGVCIGRFCEIQAGAVIGDEGFGFERDAESRPLRMIHVGGVRIGDHVLIGANTAVARGALGDTVLEDYVKVNNLVHIAHNCRIGEGTIIGACADLCGSLTVGRNSWIAPNSSIRQKLVIGEEAVIGIGAVVVRDVAPRTTVYGNPAKSARPPDDGPASAP